MTDMLGLRLPGGRRVEFDRVPVPTPGHGQVLVRMKASSICGSDIRAIYREHLGHGPEAYQDVIAGHEPCGQVVAVGPGCERIAEGDRVVLYHIAGCGQCANCRRGYMIGCSSARRAAYGWQRDGGHAEYLLAEEATCVPLPEPLTYVDGACVACGFGTAYEALWRLQVSGADRLLVTGLGPVGQAAAMIARGLGVTTVIGTDASAERAATAVRLGLVDHVVQPGPTALEEIRALTDGDGCEASVDCSGVATARELAIAGTREWGRFAFVGEGGSVTLDVSPMVIHRQLTIHGSWVTSLGHMADLLALLVRWGRHPEDVVTDRFALEDGEAAYQLADAGQSGKVCIVFE